MNSPQLRRSPGEVAAAHRAAPGWSRSTTSPIADASGAPGGPGFPRVPRWKASGTSPTITGPKMTEMASPSRMFTTSGILWLWRSMISLTGRHSWTSRSLHSAVAGDGSNHQSPELWWFSSNRKVNFRLWIAPQLSYLIFSVSRIRKQHETTDHQWGVRRSRIILSCHCLHAMSRWMLCMSTGIKISGRCIRATTLEVHENWSLAISTRHPEVLCPGGNLAMDQY